MEDGFALPLRRGKRHGCTSLNLFQCRDGRREAGRHRIDLAPEPITIFRKGRQLARVPIETLTRVRLERVDVVRQSVALRRDRFDPIVLPAQAILNVGLPDLGSRKKTPNDMRPQSGSPMGSIESDRHVPRAA